MGFKKFFKDYFTLSKTQQYGSIVLIFLILIVAVAPRIVSCCIEKKRQPDFSKFREIMDNYVEWTEPTEPDSPVRNDTVFTFDPNLVTYDDLLCLGLSEKVSSNIIKYRKSGGKFKTPADFSKIYGINDSIFARLKPYISIQQNSQQQKKSTKTKRDNVQKQHSYGKSERSESKLTIIELNTADSAQLVLLRGIGPVLAKRIITYRNLLGGFYSVEQLREIRNLSDETYTYIYMQLSADTSSITKIDINDFKYRQLSNHPYMSLSQLNSIMNYKRLMGNFSSVSDLLKYKLVDTLTYEKISPYLEAK